MAYRDVILSDSPIEYWEMSEASGSSVASAGSGAHSGTATGTTIVSGRVGNARSFNGTSDYVASASVADFTAGTAYTMEAWVKATTSNTNGKDWLTIVRRDGSGVAVLMRMAGSTSGIQQGAIQVYHNGRFVSTGTTRFDDGQWHHVVMTRSSTTVKLYVDGVEYTTASGTASGGATGTANAVMIGASGGPVEFFAGQIDEVAIYTTALSATRVTAHYNATGVDITLDAQSISVANFDVVAGPVTNVTVDVDAATASVNNSDATVPNIIVAEISPNLDFYTDGTSIERTTNTTLFTAQNAGSNTYTYVMFTLPSNIQTLRSASLSVYIDTPSDNIAANQYLMRGVTNNSGSNPSTWTKSGSINIGPESASAGTKTINVLSLVSLASFDGFMLDIVRSGANYDGFSIRSNEWADAQYRPKLTISYEAVSEGQIVDLDSQSIQVGNSDATSSIGVTNDATVADTISAQSFDVTVETENIPDVYIDVDAATVTISNTDVTVVTPVEVVLDAQSISVNNSDVTVEVHIGAVAFLDTPIIQTQAIVPESVQGIPPEVVEEDDPYFVSTMRTLTGAYWGVQSNNNYGQLTPVSWNSQYWLRLNETSGNIAYDRAWDPENPGVGKGDLVNNGATIGLNNGPNGRKNYYFDGSDFLRQPENYATGYDEVFANPTSLEFTFRTEKSTQFLMGGADAQGGITITLLPTWELWVEDGILTVRKYNFDGTVSYADSAIGRTRVDDGEWHHVVLQNAYQTNFYSNNPQTQLNYMQFEMWVDGRLEKRQRRGQVAQGFPDWIAGRTEITGRGEPALALTDWFVGDLTEIVYRNGRSLTEDEVTTQRDNMMGILSYRPEAARATVFNDDVIAKGNRKKVLILSITGRSKNEVNFGQSWPVTDKARAAQASFVYSDVESGSVYLDHPGFGDTGVHNYPWYRAGDYLYDIVGVFGPAPGYSDPINGNYRIINLMEDLNMEEYDMISVKGYPTTEAAWRQIDVWDEYNQMPFEPMRKQLENLLKQVQEQVVSYGKGLFITEPQIAIAMDIVDRVEYVPHVQESAVFDNRLGAVVGGFDTDSLYKDPFKSLGPDDGFGPGFPTGDTLLNASRYDDTNLNTRQVVRSEVPGLTDIPSWIKTDELRKWNIDPDASPPWVLSKKFAEREHGLFVGDEFHLNDDGMYSPDIDLPYPWVLEGRNGFVAAPIEYVNVGTVVTSFAPKIYGYRGRSVNGEPLYRDEIDNPFYNYAVSIAIEPGDEWDGQIVTGRAYIGFTDPKSYLSDQQKGDYIMKTRERGFPDGIGEGDRLPLYSEQYVPITDEMLEWQFSTAYWSFTGTTAYPTEGNVSVVIDPSTGVPDIAFKPKQNVPIGVRWHLSGVGTEGIYTPTIGNRGFLWALGASVASDGNAVVSAATATSSINNSDVVVESEASADITIETVHVAITANDEQDSDSVGVTVLAGLPTINIVALKAAEDVLVEPAIITIAARDVEGSELYINYDEALVMVIPKHSLTLTLEVN